MDSTSLYYLWWKGKTVWVSGENSRQLFQGIVVVVMKRRWVVYPWEKLGTQAKEYFFFFFEIITPIRHCSGFLHPKHLLRPLYNYGHRFKSHGSLLLSGPGTWRKTNMKGLQTFINTRNTVDQLDRHYQFWRPQVKHEPRAHGRRNWHWSHFTKTCI